MALTVGQRSQITKAKADTTNPQPVGQTAGWNTIFSDEFNLATLDGTKWTPGWFGTGITGPVNSAETACYDSAQVGQPGDGNLHLHLIAQQNICSGSTRPYTGSLVSSNGKFQYTYGYVEFRAFLPAASAGVMANWPAVWSDGQSWPTDGENDTMEGLSGKACYHFPTAPGNPGGCAAGDFTGWHTFGSDWEPGSVTYYYDGVQVGQITTGITSSPQYLILDNSQGTYGGPTAVPSDMLVDYVRVWQKCTINCITPTPTPTPTPVPPTPTPVPADTTPPNVSITSPLNGATVSKGSTVTITANATDNVGVSKVEFYINGSLKCTVVTANYSCNWSVPSKPNITYTLKAVAYDAANNSSINSITVTAK